MFGRRQVKLMCFLFPCACALQFYKHLLLYLFQILAPDKYNLGQPCLPSVPAIVLPFSLSPKANIFVYGLWRISLAFTTMIILCPNISKINYSSFRDKDSRVLDFTRARLVVTPSCPIDSVNYTQQLGFSRNLFSTGQSYNHF